MIKVLIIDDNNNKLIKIIEAIRQIYSELIIDTAIDLISAKRLLNVNIYELLILDIQLPNYEGDKIIEDGGVKLLKELYVNKTLFIPKYVIGLTAFKGNVLEFSNIWPLVEYEPNNIEWLNQIKDMITHISKTIKYDSNKDKIIETVFLEGQTDQKIFNDMIKLFRPDLIEKMQFKATKSGGAKWVTRQIISWAFSLQKRINTDKYIKSIGLFDNDESGNQSRKEINRIISNDSAQSTTFKVISLDYKYAKHLLPLVKKGIKIPVALEEMFPNKYWKYAQSKQWLELRRNNNDYLEDPKDWDKYSMSLVDHMKNLGLNDDELIYTYKFKNENKIDFVNYIIGLDKEEKKIAYDCFKLLVDDIEAYLWN